MKTEITHILGGLVCFVGLLLSSPALAAPDDQVKPPQTPPTDPTPTNPTPSDPTPTNPTPTNPAPTPTQPSTPPLPLDDIGGQTPVVNPEPASELLWTQIGLAGARHRFHHLRKQRHR